MFGSSHGSSILLVLDDVDAAQIMHILAKHRFANRVVRLRRAREVHRYLAEAPLPELVMFSQAGGGAVPALESLRKEMPGVPLIFLASNRPEEGAASALGLPRTCCLLKPFGFFKLLEAMQKLEMHWIVLQSSP